MSGADKSALGPAEITKVGRAWMMRNRRRAGRLVGPGLKLVGRGKRGTAGGSGQTVAMMRMAVMFWVGLDWVMVAAGGGQKLNGKQAGD